MLVKWSFLKCHCHTMQCCSMISWFGLFMFSASHCFPLLSCPSVWSTVFDPLDCEVDRLSFASIIWPPPYRNVFASLKPYLWVLNCWSCAFESRELRLSVRVKETHIRAKSRMGWLCKICLIISAQATNLYFFQCIFCCPTSNITHNMFHSKFLF